jgi:hypothetical protein
MLSSYLTFVAFALRFLSRLFCVFVRFFAASFESACAIGKERGGGRGRDEGREEKRLKVGD